MEIKRFERPIINNNSIVLLLDNNHPSLLLENNTYIKLKTRGKVISTRKLETDKERCYLIKFRGIKGHRHVQEAWIAEILGGHL